MAGDSLSIEEPPLKDRYIAFIERDARADPEAAEALAATGTFATPLLVIGHQKVLGFRPKTLAAVLLPPGTSVNTAS